MLVKSKQLNECADDLARMVRQLSDAQGKVESAAYGLSSMSGYRTLRRILERKAQEISGTKSDIHTLASVLSCAAEYYERCEEKVVDIMENADDVHSMKSGAPKFTVSRLMPASMIGYITPLTANITSKTLGNAFTGTISTGMKDALSQPKKEAIWEGSCGSISSAFAATFMGVTASGSAELSGPGYKVEKKNSAKWSIKDGEAEIEKSLNLDAQLAKGTIAGSLGNLSGTINTSVGAVEGKGKIGFGLFSENKFRPNIEMGVSGSVSALKGDFELVDGDNNANTYVKGEGSLFTVKGEVGASAGHITYTDKNTGEVKDGWGVKGEAGFEAYAAEGKIKGGFQIGNLKLDVGLSGKAGGAGATVGGYATTGGVRGKIGAGLGLGFDLEVGLEWE